MVLEVILLMEVVIFSFFEKARCNEVKKEKASVAGWFKASSSGSGSDYIYWAGKDGSANEKRFTVFIDVNHNIAFEFKSDDNVETKCTTSGTNYRDNNWHHFVGVRTGDYACELFIDGNSVDTGSSTPGGDEDVKMDDGTIGARLEDKDQPDGADFFQGSLDDIMVWQKYALNSAEVTDLYNTNYGNAAHKITFNLDRTDVSGSFLETIANNIQYPMNFSDGKRDSQFFIKIISGGESQFCKTTQPKFSFNPFSIKEFNDSFILRRLSRSFFNDSTALK